MPPDGVPLQTPEKILSSSEILTLAQMFTSLGITKIRLTGGEPLLRPDLIELVASLGSLANVNSIGMTTNGLTLTRKKLIKLKEGGLTGVNISLDTLIDEKFVEVTRRKGLSKVLENIDHAVEVLGGENVKVNVVVMKGFNCNELADFVAMTKHRNINMRFIEWMPFSDNGWR